jgi:cation:H+ antiporter
MAGSVLLVGGLVWPTIGAELVVPGATRLARPLGVRPFVLGLTFVAVGTSSGANLFNSLFIVGLSALLRPLPLHLRVLRLELPMMVIAAVLMIGLAQDGVLTGLDGDVLAVPPCSRLRPSPV